MMELNLKKNMTYSESEIYDLVKKKKNDISKQSFKWILYQLEQNGITSRIGTQRYITGLTKYQYESSEKFKDIKDYLNRTFPDVDYVVWESVQLNEWINFLINLNTIYIEVEKELFDFVVDGLMGEFSDKYTILINPDEETISRYRRDDLVIIKKLFSRSPIDKKKHNIKLEKLMIDLLCDKNYISMIDSSAIEDIYAGVKKTYAIDVTKMMNYAKRRGVFNKASELWGLDND